MRPGQIERAVGHTRVLIFFHKRKRALPAFCHADDEIEHDGFLRLQDYRSPQGDDGIKDRTLRIRKPLLHRCWVGRGPAPPDELETIGFAGNLTMHAALANHHMQQPGRLFLFGARTAGAKNGRRGRQELSLHEQVAEGWMRLV